MEFNFFFLILRIHVGLISGKSTYYKQEITQYHKYDSNTCTCNFSLINDDHIIKRNKNEHVQICTD